MVENGGNAAECLAIPPYEFWWGSSVLFLHRNYVGDLFIYQVELNILLDSFQIS